MLSSPLIIKRKDFRALIVLEKLSIAIENKEGDMIDRDNNFRKGAVGVVGREGSSSEIGSFTVCASSCR